MRVQSLPELIMKINEDPELAKDIQEYPAKAIAKAATGSPLGTDKWIYRVVVLALGLTALAEMIGTIYLVAPAGGKVTDIPEILMALGSAAVGALAGLLAPSPHSG